MHEVYDFFLVCFYYRLTKTFLSIKNTLEFHIKPIESWCTSGLRLKSKKWDSFV